VFSITPLSIEERIAASDGAITGWSFTESVPAVNQVLKGQQAVRTVLPNILQAGQWTYSPAGVPMVILTGKLAADEILKK
jgi:phytoene dehydrogenase-like protein